MKLAIPAKTFLVGEYLALTGGPAIVITTNPCFELHQCTEPGLQGIHIESPAGRLWARQPPGKSGFKWHDPYNGLGGMGASGAQFLSVYRAKNHDEVFCAKDMINDYLEYSYNGRGTAPSGYDILAQSAYGCVYIDAKQNLTCYTWPFKDISFILLHSGRKIATHHHLESFNGLQQVEQLTHLVHMAQLAFSLKDSELLINSINLYYETLIDLDLVTQHTRNIIQQLKSEPDLLAAKGCGALGSDIILLIVPTNKIEKWKKDIIPQNLRYIADNNALYANPASKILDILV